MEGTHPDLIRKLKKMEQQYKERLRMAEVAKQLEVGDSTINFGETYYHIFLCISCTVLAQRTCSEMGGGGQGVQLVHGNSAAKLAEKRGSEDRQIGTAMICRSLGIGMIGIGSVISCINTINSTQISIARTTATIILACHRSQQCWFQFRKTTKFFERDKINQNFVSIVCICSVNLLCYLFGEIYLYFSWIVHTQKKISRSPISHLKIGDRKWSGKSPKIGRSDLAALHGNR